MQYKKVYFYGQSHREEKYGTTLSGGYYLYNSHSDDIYRIEFRHWGIPPILIKIDGSHETTVTISKPDASDKLELESYLFSSPDRLDDIAESKLENFGVNSRQSAAIRYAVFGLLNNGPFKEYIGSFKII